MSPEPPQPSHAPEAPGPGAPSPRPAAALAALARLAALLLLALALVWLVLALQRRVEARGFARIDATRARMDIGPGWVDPRWSEELRLALAELGSVPADDAEAVEAVARRLRGLPFVEAVGAPRVLWPDGLRLELRLREPVACLVVARQFVPLAADGTLLSGRWPTPPARGSGFLPVVQPGDPTLGARGRPGARLVDEPLLDGLSIASSMWRELAAVDLARLGRIVIDARAARRADVEQAGAVLLLEGERCVLFGRAPVQGEPGELPVEHKWSLVARALDLLDPRSAAARGEQAVDWSLVDVRWDQGALRLRDGGD